MHTLKKMVVLSFIGMVGMGMSFEAVHAAVIPKEFVYLKEVDPTIIQAMRYAGDHNFVGRVIKGYQAPTCILTQQAAFALSEIQNELKQSGLSLKVYDCYRPQMAVDDFYAWSQKTGDESMKSEFYPDMNKKDLFAQGYIALKSGHTRGSTVDVTIVNLPLIKGEKYRKGQKLESCMSSYQDRFFDGSIDMGTGYDCMSVLSSPDDKSIPIIAYHNRELLKDIMERHGFTGYAKEWWHFTLQNEPFPDQYFNFPVTYV